MRSQLSQVSAGTALAMAMAERAEASTVEQWGDMLINSSPIIFLLVFTPCLFIYLILKSNYQKKVYLAAIEKGMPLPEKKQTDPRKTALILMAFGIGFFLSTLILFTFVWITEPDQPPPPVAICAFGFIPFLIGAAQWKYVQLIAKENDGARSQ